MDKRALTGPVEATDRIESLDVLRGFAVLGILVMNIQAFSMPGAAYFNPTVYGDLSGINFFTWLISYLLVDQKFMSLFSLLFGAGVCLFADRAEARSGRSAGLHYRRMFLSARFRSWACLSLVVGRYIGRLRDLRLCHLSF